MTARKPEIVRDEHDANTFTLAERAEHLEGMFLGRLVHGRGRLVEEGEFGLRHHGASEQHALLLPLGELTIASIAERRELESLEGALDLAPSQLALPAQERNPALGSHGADVARAHRVKLVEARALRQVG
jgi:hypothetical protein